jgi:hypothetical protein
MARTKNNVPYLYSFLFGRTLVWQEKNTCPIPLIDSLFRNLENGNKKEYMSYTSHKFSFEEP